MKISTSEEMFGKAKQNKIQATHHDPDFSILREDFENPNAVAFAFCKGCGSDMELTEDQVNEFTKKTGQERPEDTRKYLFYVGGCECCDGDSEDVKIIMKN